MVRPSYVLGGRGMEVVYDDESMSGYMKAAVGVTPVSYTHLSPENTPINNIHYVYARSLNTSRVL